MKSPKGAGISTLEDKEDEEDFERSDLNPVLHHRSRPINLIFWSTHLGLPACPFGYVLANTSRATSDKAFDVH